MLGVQVGQEGWHVPGMKKPHVAGCSAAAVAGGCWKRKMGGTSGTLFPKSGGREVGLVLRIMAVDPGRGWWPGWREFGGGPAVEQAWRVLWGWVPRFLSRACRHAGAAERFSEPSPEKYLQVKRSITAEGIGDRLGVLPDYTLIGGHLRLRAVDLGMTHVPVWSTC